METQMTVRIKMVITDCRTGNAERGEAEEQMRREQKKA